MTARKSGSRLETELERCRSECQWDKIPELVRQLSAKLISNGKKEAGFGIVGSLSPRGLHSGPRQQHFRPRLPSLTTAALCLDRLASKGQDRDMSFSPGILPLFGFVMSPDADTLTLCRDVTL